jgi:hypothetical protein
VEEAPDLDLERDRDRAEGKRQGLVNSFQCEWSGGRTVAYEAGLVADGFRRPKTGVETVISRKAALSG